MLIIKRGFQYRDLGGHPFYKERELDTNTVIDKAMFEGNWACINFMERRDDYDCSFPHKLYYGHSDDGLGYVIAEDELEEISDEEWDKEKPEQRLPKSPIRRLFCKMGWHSHKYDILGSDGTNVHAKCRWCGMHGTIDSQGNLSR